MIPKIIASAFSRAVQLVATVIITTVALSTTSAQVTDNFDSGTLDPAWKKSNFNSALVQESFENSGSGKAFRIRANPLPGQAPAAAMYYRDDVFTDFYMAVDLTDWPGTDKNQAFVMVARGNLSANPATTTGVILNYDASQYGENATDRRQGQFQINLVTNSPAFGTKTLAVTEITLQPGRSYRFVFTGVGSRYTGKIFDHHDLTRPLVTIAADDVIQGPGGNISFDAGFSSGKFGILAFSRQSTAGTADVTIDNFYVGAADPNAAASSLPHPVAGTPVVSERTPAERFKNFHNPADGISFTAKTSTADTINAGASKLWLNGVDYSGKLQLSANGSTITGSFPGSELAANKVYSGIITLEDSTGAKKSTNSFWFDTFSDAYVASSAVKVIEAEDYNYGFGTYVAGPIPVSGVNTNSEAVNSGLGYAGQVGATSGVEAEAIDYFNVSGTPNEYRGDTIGVLQGMTPELIDVDHATAAATVDRYSDNVRAKYASQSMLEFVVNRTQPSEWMNYTRSFVPGSYRAYLRVASFGSTVVELRKVTSAANEAAQTTSKVGNFAVPNLITRYNYRYVPLTDDNGAPITVNLSGVETLRLQMAGVTGQDDRKLAINYLLLVPILNVNGPTVADTFTDGNDTANPIWEHVDPLGGLGLPPAQYTFPNGAYRVLAPTPPILDAGTARAFTLLKDVTVSDFYISVDLVDFDDTVRQVLGIGARITQPGLGTTDGYLFTWEPGGGTLPTVTGGDLDMLRIVDEVPTGQIETESSSFHLERGRSYRMVLIGTGFDFEGRIYELPDASNPVRVLHGRDTQEAFASGGVGLIVADQTSGAPNQGDATFDNFLVTVAEPRISFARSGANVTLTWPRIPFRLQSSPTVGPAVWTDISTGITQDAETNSYAAGNATAFYRLIYP